jgi:hypothetical protein
VTGSVLHEALGAGFVIPGNLLVLVSGYMAILATLVVFGIWGFRLGSQHSGGKPPGGGPKRPEPTPSPPGGRELADEQLPADLDVSRALEPVDPEELVQVPERELVGPRSGV